MQALTHTCVVLTPRMSYLYISIVVACAAAACRFHHVLESIAQAAPPSAILAPDAVRCPGPGSLLGRCVLAVRGPLLQPVHPEDSQHNAGWLHYALNSRSKGTCLAVERSCQHAGYEQPGSDADSLCVLGVPTAEAACLQSETGKVCRAQTLLQLFTSLPSLSGSAL